MGSAWVKPQVDSQEQAVSSGIRDISTNYFSGEQFTVEVERSESKETSDIAEERAAAKRYRRPRMERRSPQGEARHGYDFSIMFITS